MLYPLKFKPRLKERIWGGDKLGAVLGKTVFPGEKIGESWEISGVQDDLSVITNGFLKDNNLQEVIEIYMDEIVGEANYEKYGIEFPILVKFIDAHDVHSIQHCYLQALKKPADIVNSIIVLYITSLIQCIHHITGHINFKKSCL